MEKVDLWKKYAVDFPVESFLGQVAIDLGFDENAYRQLLIDLKRRKEHFEFSPLFGNTISFDNHFGEKKTVITEKTQSETIDFKDLVRMLSIIDRVFMPILPLGTVVKLNEEQILEDDLKYLESIRSDLTVQIIGQKIISGDGFYVDYISSIWPVGLNLVSEPIIVNNVMIEEVMQKGYSNDFSQEYQDALREKILREGYHPISFEWLLEVLMSEN